MLTLQNVAYLRVMQASKSLHLLHISNLPMLKRRLKIGKITITSRHVMQNCGKTTIKGLNCTANQLKMRIFIQTIFYEIYSVWHLVMHILCEDFPVSEPLSRVQFFFILVHTFNLARGNWVWVTCPNVKHCAGCVFTKYFSCESKFRGVSFWKFRKTLHSVCRLVEEWGFFSH